MHRIDTASATTGGLFQDGNAQIGQLATQFAADWFNDVQENIAYVIEQADIALSKGDYTQLRAAIIAIAQGAIGTGTGEVPTSTTVTGGGLITGGGALVSNLVLTLAKAAAADILAGINGTKAITPDNLASLFGIASTASPPASNGSIKLPGGMILKYGGTDAHTTLQQQVEIDFPTPFPNACLRAVLTGLNLSAAPNWDCWPQLVSKSATSLVAICQWTGYIPPSEATLDGIEYWAIGY